MMVSIQGNIWGSPDSGLARSMIAFLVLMAISPSLSFAQTPDSAVTFRTLPWELMIALAITASYTIVALAYMAAEGFALSDIKAWASNEAYQITAILIVMFLVFVTVRIENSIFESFGYAPSPTNPNPAITAAQSTLDVSKNYLVVVASSGYVSNTILVGLLKNRVIDAQFLFTKNATEHLYDSLSSVIGMAIGGIQLSIGIVTAQIWFLDLIARTAFTIFLPLGILLRTFTFSRGIGAFFISISIAFYLVYPLTFILDQHILNALLCQPESQCAPDTWTRISQIRVSSLPTESTYKDTTGSALVGAITSFKTILSETAFAFVTFTMLAILNFIITAGVTRSIANLMGYDFRLSDIIKIM